jgi:hypothetical protein
MGRLPLRDSEEGQIIIQRYQAGERLTLATELRFPNVASFTRAMRQVYEVRVGGGNQGWEPSGLNIPLKLDTAKEKVTVPILHDTHNPYHDAETLALVERFLQDIEFPYLLYGGDNNDFYGISRFDKNPARVDRLQEDIDSTKAMFYRHSKLFPNTEKILIGGNHEDRLRVFLWSNAAALSSLRCLGVPELFRLSDYGIDYVPYEQGLMINNSFLVLHGNIASVHSGYTAKRMYEKHGGCGICGHCHRLGSFYKRDRFGTWGWWENGCLCHLNPDWIKNPNWVQGFSLVHFQGKRFWVEQIPIIDHTLMYGGTVYK